MTHDPPKPKDVRPVVGYEGIYSVSRCGRIWSEPRVVDYGRGHKRKAGGVWLKPMLRGPLYMVVSLHDINGLNPAYVHQIVAHAYLGSPPVGMEIDHIDRDSRNNHIDNLRYVTKTKNVMNRDCKGYYFRPSRNKWQVRLRHKNKNVCNKLCATEEEAHAVYMEARNKIMDTIQ